MYNAMETSCTRFTAAEGGARLAVAAGEKNILAVEYASFITTRLVHEDAYKIRGPLSSGRQRSVYVSRASRVPCVAYELTIMTDLKVVSGLTADDRDWADALETNEVLVCPSVVLRRVLAEGVLNMAKINVLIIDSCHLVCSDENLQFIMKLYKQSDELKRPRILSLTYPLFSSPKKHQTQEQSSESTENKSPKHDGECDSQNGDRSFKSGEDCVKSGEDSVKSGEESVKSGEDCVKSGEESFKSGEDGVKSGEESVKSGEESGNRVKRDANGEVGVYENLDDFEMYEKLEWKIEELEKELCCEMDLAEDIDGGKRILGSLSKPKELIIEYSGRKPTEELSEEYLDLEAFMKNAVDDAVQFIEEHRYDPTEIYGEDLYEEFKNIPDPNIEPLMIFKQFLYVLDQLGPYAADKAAFSLLTKLEKLKIKVPYERHFLLLCLCTTVFVKIRCYADEIFSKHDSDWDKIKLFCTPKVLRFAEILQKFQPADSVKSTSESISKMLSDIEKCDFTSLGDRIEDKVNTYEANLKEIVELDSGKTDCGDSAGSNVDSAGSNVDSAGSNVDSALNKVDSANNDVDSANIKIDSECNKTNKVDSAHSNVDSARNAGDGDANKMDSAPGPEAEPRCKPAEYAWRARRGARGGRGGRARGRGRGAGGRAPPPAAPDALCGIVFVHDPLLAKILFMLIVDMSRAHPSLEHLCAQYCCVEAGADPAAEAREAQRQARAREEVLKKFRMHECNLLLATSALEEGIDLPRCNLVLRWDVPQSYRSHGLCRGRARAARAACAVLCRDDEAGQLMDHLAKYREVDQVISRKCGCGVQNEPPPSEEDHADGFSLIIKPYTPQNTSKDITRNESDIEHDRDKDDIKGNDSNVKDFNVKDSNVKDINVKDCNVKVINVKDSNVKDINVKDSNELNEKLNDLTISEKDAKATLLDNNVILKNTHRNDVCESFDSIEKADNENNTDSGVCDIDIKDINNVDSARTDNLFCNRCNSMKNSVSVECPCATMDNLCDIKDKVNSKVERDHKKHLDSELASVDLNTAIALINRYCGKLPSDTFTRLAPQWWLEEVLLPVRGSGDTRRAFVCTLRLPLNCPVKYNIVGHPMPTRVLARRMVALQACRILHKSGELDNQLMPIGKENFKAAELDAGNNFVCGDADAADSARPGTTKRRQYYYKRTAWAFTDCEPVIDASDSEIDPPGKAGEPREPQESRKSGDPGEPRKAPESRDSAEVKNLSEAPESQQSRKSGEAGKLSEVPESQESRMSGEAEKLSGAPESQKSQESGEVKPSGDESPKVDPEHTKKGVKRNMLYAIVSTLCCALPERYNTRGRRLHAPQHASHALALLMARPPKPDLQIPAFPVYTRSGEVRVSVEHVPDADVRMSPRRARLVRRFMRFVFSSVLRVRRRGMKLQSEGSTHNNYYIVPTVKSTRDDGTTKIDVDWAFLELIYQHTEELKKSEVERPLLWQHDEDDDEPKAKVEKHKDKDGKSVKVLENPLLKPGETFVFDPELYKEAVVTPWYRNQDQPQFFLVAEICWHLTPESAFPSATHTSFREYYRSKYGVTLTQSAQPLLDVDHTSARLNLLTPRYVNRKGVALPVSSERTRRAKRDRLDQKQILVPELCRVHPFAAPLWFATVAAPCVLYRINALLIADEIRRAVAVDVGLGAATIDPDTCPGFRWPPLDFGWSLAEVLSADSEKTEKKKDDEDSTIREDKDKDIKEEEVKEKEDGQKQPEETKEKTLNDILAEKEETESGFEIGTWSNDMASSIPDSMEYDEYMEPLPSNLTFCTSASGGTNWCDPIEKPKSQFNPSRTFSMAESDCSYMSSDFDTDDSDLNTDSDEDTDTSGFWSKNSMGVRIEYKTAHEAEAVDVEKKSKKKPQPQPDADDDARDRLAHKAFVAAGHAPAEYIEKFRSAVTEHRKDILTSGNLIKSNETIADILPETKEFRPPTIHRPHSQVIEELFPYGNEELVTENGQITLESIERNKRKLLQVLKEGLTEDEVKKMNCFSMVDVDIDSPDYVNEKIVNVGFDTKESYMEKISRWDSVRKFKPYYNEGRGQGKEFDFDFQPDLEGHPGPSPSVILQALTMSNANDGINLERLETVGDSFLKFAITAYLYCAHPTVHEGKLSHMRSKQVSNLNLYRLGRSRRLGARMIASKFEPHDNWLPPCHRPPHTHAPPNVRGDGQDQSGEKGEGPVDGQGCFIPYNLITQHSIPDKSIADCVEALIGAYLLECGPRGALVFMSWLGIRVLPRHDLPLPPGREPHTSAQDDQKQSPMPSPRRARSSSESDTESRRSPEPPRALEEPPPEPDAGWAARPPGSLRPYQRHGQWFQPIFGELKAPPSPLLRYISDPEGELEQMLSGYDALERTLQYRFRDRSLLLQALTHASHQRNRLTDCYQRLEFLGDAILDYLITRHLYEDARRHSPGALTDLRSALVNNTIFATLAAKHGFHKYFRHMSPGLNEVLTRYVKIQEENGHSISEEHYLIQEDEMEQAEDVEVPKALGDLFESVAGAIFLDSGMSLGAVWKSYVQLMGAELEAFSAAAPKSPVRELLEAEPDTAKFGKPERLADGRRVRVCVEVFGRGAFKGIGRNYRIAKGTAARCALRHLRASRPR